MPVSLGDGRLQFVQLALSLDEFPVLLKNFHAAEPDTSAIEKEAQTLAEHGFPVHEIVTFVKRVCSWGGYAGVAGRIQKHNLPGSLVKAFRMAHAANQRDAIVEAMNALLELSGFGVSFASKHLKFLDPARHVVLDSIISTRLGYPRDVDGYCRFLVDCRMISRMLDDARISPSHEAGAPWRVADVESAIFQKLRS